VRLQKYLADAGVCSRRTGEALIQQGRVRVNRRPVTTPGTKVVPGTDLVEVDGRPVGKDGAKVYIALNKPKGIVTSCRHAGQPIVLNLVDIAQRVFPIGRLDKESSGLLILTNDGPMHHRLSHPSFDHEKVYEVTVARPITDEALGCLAAGVVLEEKPTRPAGVKRLDPQRFEIVLREGRKRQIRRMVEAVGNRVVELKRIGFAGIDLGRLAPGTWRHLSPSEIRRLQGPARQGRAERNEKKTQKGNDDGAGAGHRRRRADPQAVAPDSYPGGTRGGRGGRRQ